MDNIQEVRKQLLKNMNDIKDGNLPVKEAEAINNAAGKVIKTAVVELKYLDMREEKPNIPFLNNNSQKQIEGEH